MSKRPKYTVTLPPRKLLIILAIVVVLLAGLITINEWAHIDGIPTWNDLFVAMGLKENVTLPEGKLRLTVRDAGNADCLLFQTGDHYMLIDAGENNNGKALVEYLDRNGISKLDYVIATHADADHIGGMDEVINHVEIGTFIMSFMPEGHTPTTRTYEKMLTALLNRNIKPTEAHFGDSYTFGEAKIDILSGQKDYTNNNDQSVVCRITFGKTHFLMMGDAGVNVENDILSAGVDIRSDVIKLGHHGSHSSSGEAFIRAVNPAYALITSGADNDYGHPHKETLQLLKKENIPYYRSDVCGEIQLVSDGNTVSVTTEK